MNKPSYKYVIVFMNTCTKPLVCIKKAANLAPNYLGLMIFQKKEIQRPFIIVG